VVAVYMNKQCEGCGRTVAEKNSFCSAKCFKQHYGYKDEDSIFTVIKAVGMQTEELIPEETV
jgi:hypothetical protein